VLFGFPIGVAGPKRCRLGPPRGVIGAPINSIGTKFRKYDCDKYFFYFIFLKLFFNYIFFSKKLVHDYTFILENVHN
jgi:hypothetical protein